MKHIGNIFTFLLLLFASHAAAQWGWQPIHFNQAKRVQSVNFIDDDRGYAMLTVDQTGAKTLEKTTDGGATWTVIPLPVSGAEFQSFHFNADGHGVAVFRNLQTPVTPTMIFQTTNDGLNWQDITPDTTATGMGTAACQFLDDNIGFFATDAFIYATTDGGTTWRTDSISGGYPMSLDFIDADHGTVGLFDGTFNYMGGMLTTTNGGQTWTQTNLTEIGAVIGVVRQLTLTTAIAAPIKFSGYPKLKFFKTTDNGSTWDTIFVPDTLPDPALSEIDFLDAQNGVIAVSSQGGITNMYATSDGGNTWTLQDTMTVSTVSDLQLTINSGYFAGELSLVYRLTLEMSVPEPLQGTIGLFPNPASAGHNIRWDAEEGFTQLTMLDLSGKTVAEFDLSGDHIQLPSLPLGLYLLRFEGGGAVQTERLLVKD